MSVPADAPLGTVSCGDLRREPDPMGARWYFGNLCLGRDGEPYPIVDQLDERVSFVAARLADALGQLCDAMDGMGDASAVRAGRDALIRFERWKAGGSW